MKAHCDFLSLENKRYISISGTTRSIVLKYIANGKSIARRYYEYNFYLME